MVNVIQESIRGDDREYDTSDEAVCAGLDQVGEGAACGYSYRTIDAKGGDMAPAKHGGGAATAKNVLAFTAVSSTGRRTFRRVEIYRFSSLSIDLRNVCYPCPGFQAGGRIPISWAPSNSVEC